MEPPPIELFHFPDIHETFETPVLSRRCEGRIFSTQLRCLLQRQALRVCFQGAGHGSHIYFRCACATQHAGALRHRSAGSEDVVDQQDFAAGNQLRPGYSKRATNVLPPLMTREPGLGLSLSAAFQNPRVQYQPTIPTRAPSSGVRMWIVMASSSLPKERNHRESLRKSLIMECPPSNCVATMRQGRVAPPMPDGHHFNDLSAARRDNRPIKSRA